MANEEGAAQTGRRQVGLWDRLNAFVIESGDPEFAFEDRLERENGWSGRYTARAVQEYKRFLFLAVTASHPVSPSDQVEQVWHLHLDCTRSYWDRLCGDVLSDALHRGPAGGGIAESAAYPNWYEKTLATYTEAFGDAPPSDLWPVPGDRFGPRPRLRGLSSGS